MAKVKFRRNADVSVASVPVEDGQLLYNTETGETYEDVEGKRIQTGYKIDDAVINTSMTHSSKKVVDEICPEFTETGPVVTCHPVPGYPLHVVSKLAVQQEGSGDPSPENVRPFVPYEKAEMTRCGGNLLKMWYNEPVIEKNGLKITANDDLSFTVNGTALERMSIPVSGYGRSWPAFKGTFLVKVPGVPEGTIFNAYGTRTDGKPLDIRSTNTKDQEIVANGRINVIILTVQAGTVFDNVVIKPQISVDPNTPYAPYTGETYTAQLPPDTYGGEVDWEKGNGLFLRYEKLNGHNWRTDASNVPNHPRFRCDDFDDVVDKPESSSAVLALFDCTALKPSSGDGTYLGRGDGIAFDKAGHLTAYVDAIKGIDAWVKFIAEKDVAIVFPLKDKTPTPITPSATPTALPGTNTLYSSTGDTTVTGAEDPRHTIKALTDRVNALENQATGI